MVLPEKRELKGSDRETVEKRNREEGHNPLCKRLEMGEKGKTLRALRI